MEFSTLSILTNHFIIRFNVRRTFLQRIHHTTLRYTIFHTETLLNDLKIFPQNPVG